MNKLITAVVLTVLIYFSVLSQQQQYGYVVGRVTNSDDHQPITGANVTIQATVMGTITDNAGQFKIPRLPLGEYTLTVSMIGFKKKDTLIVIRDNKANVLNIEIEPSAVQTATVVITASKREQSLQDVASSVSVVDDKLLTQRNAITIDQALQFVPGVNIARSQISIRGSTGYSHGVGTRVLLLIDGLPFLSGDTEEIIWESIPTTNVDRIEVVKGSGSALYGSSALGGVINVITKSISQKPETKFRVYGGMYSAPNYKSWQWTDLTRSFGGIYASHQQRIGDFYFSAGINRTLDDGFKQNDYWKRWNGWSRFGYDFSPYQSLSLSFNIMDQRRGNFLYWKNQDHVFEPREDQLLQKVHSNRWSLSSMYKQFLSGEIYFTTKLSWFHSRWNDNIPSASYPNGSTSSSDYFVAELQTNYQISDRNYLTAGLSTNLNRIDAESIFGVHHAAGGAIFLQDEIKFFDNLRTTIGGRYDFQKLEGTKNQNQFNPKLGIVYRPFDFGTIRGSLGRGFRSPSVAEVYTNTDAGGIVIMPNPDLQPERSWSYELGCSIFPGDNVALDVSLFRNEFWDLIEPTFGTDGKVHFQNITRARITGTELSLSINIFKKLWTNRLSYTYTNPIDVTKNEIMKYRSRHLFYVSTELSPEPFHMGIDFRYLSRMEQIDQQFVLLGIVPDGDVRVPVYVVDIHSGLNWDFAGLPLVTLFHINNLLQYYYVDMIGNMAPIRNFVFTVESQF